MRKIRFIGIVGIAVMIITAGCTQNGTKDSGKVKITILGENTANIQSLMTLKKAYEQTHPNIELDFRPETYDEAFQKSNSDFQHKTGLYDIVMQYNFSLSSFVQNDYVYKLDDLLQKPDSAKTGFEKYIFPTTWHSVGYFYKDDHNPAAGMTKVGYPFAANSMLLIYNKQMFADPENQRRYQQQYGKALTVPKTWDDYTKSAAFFTNPAKGTYGVCLEGATGGYLYYEWLNYLVGQGGNVLDKHYGWEGNAATKVTLNSPAAVKALTYMINLKKYNRGNFTDVEQFKKLTLMKEGKTAMAIGWDDVIVSTLKSAKGFDPRFGFATIPGDRSFIGGGAFFISKQSHHPREALDFILYVMQPNTQVLLGRNGLSSPLVTTYSDSVVAAYPHTAALKASMQRGGIYPEAGPDSKMIDEVMSSYIQKAWAGELTPAAAIKKAADEIAQKRPGIFKAVNAK